MGLKHFFSVSDFFFVMTQLDPFVQFAQSFHFFFGGVGVVLRDSLFALCFWSQVNSGLWGVGF